ncbi:2-dehydropantoate 2-reductase N-terminal domain-containing protein [Propioniciclava soli]|uniref:2-dehydropantoate 2-reductase N-terminal domain-containing protein n=1 Tax=Propioniciclava soli TaxID=2775081 RepID=A0ABZ3C864_9ACTN
MTRYVIVGAGAVGGMIGGRLAQAEIDTAWVARGEHGRALRDRGLTLMTPEGTETLRAPVWLDPSDADLRPDDVLVFATKTQHVAEALASWADVPVTGPDGTPATAGETLPALLSTNGVAAETMALRWFRRVYGVCVWAPTANLEPGVVVARFTPTSAVLHCSRVPATLTDDADSALLNRLRADWESARLDVPLPSDVMPWKYRKLISNLGNVVQALLGSQDADDVVEAARQEARQVFEDAGIVMVDDATEAAARASGPRSADVAGAPDELGGSTWQSLTKGRGNVETDFLNGEIVALAHQIGSEAPVNAALARWGRRAAADDVRPGDLSPDALRAGLPKPSGAAEPSGAALKDGCRRRRSTKS